ncbi:MAG TPA: lipopolysaccharide heptosyltransferase II [bacterium]|nr:lipopolysaccharide heptosyltransferase II [bacterium]
MMTKDIKSIMIVKLSSIGDVVHALPIARALRDRYPHAHITWVVKRSCKDVVEGNPHIDEVMIYERERWGDPRNLRSTVQEICAFAREIRSRHFDVVVDLQGLFYTGIITYFSGCKWRIGFRNAREFAHIFYNHRVAVPTMDMHAIDRYFLLADAVDAHVRKADFTIAVSREDKEFVSAFLRDAGVSGDGKPLIAINPSARWITKQWQMEKFAELSDALARHMNATIILIGSNADRELVARLIEKMHTVPVNATGKTSLKQLVELLGRADLLISNDTGPMHIACAVGTPVLGLFGPTDPRRTGPFGFGHAVIRKDIFCSPCFKKRCRDLICMDLLTIQDVIYAIKVNLESGSFGKVNLSKVGRIMRNLDIAGLPPAPGIDVLVLSDGKPGHVNQSLGMVKHVVGLKYRVSRIKYKSELHRGLAWIAGVCGMGKVGFLRWALKPESYRSVMESVPKVVLSAGISVAAINLILGRIFKAKTVVSMKPGPIRLTRFDLAIVPMHDEPPKLKTVIQTLGAPNIIDDELLNGERDKLLKDIRFTKKVKIGILIGGETPDYFISKETMNHLIENIKNMSERLDAEVLIATSRRTPKPLERLLVHNFKKNERCKLLSIASHTKDNPIPGILGLCTIIVVTEESISMVSEAASSGKYVFVVRIDHKDNRRLKQERTIDILAQRGYIIKSDMSQLCETVAQFWPPKSPPRVLNDTETASEALMKLLRTAQAQKKELVCACCVNA